MTAKYGETKAREVAQRISSPVADAVALGAITPDDRFDGMLAVDLALYHLWVFRAASAVAAGPTVIVPVDVPTAGRWHQLA